MIATRGTLILGVLLALGAARPADAADLGGARGGSLKDDMPALMQQSAARFYVRADGSWANYDHPSITEDGKFDLVNARIGSSWSAGGGVGYYFNKNIRADLTYEHRFNASVTSDNMDPNVGGPRNFGIKSDLYLANLYYDFDSRGRFTPYVGAGLGWVNHKTSASSFTDACGCQGTIDAGSSSSVAGALMAGMAVNLTGRGAPAGSGIIEGGDAARNLYLDVGYRFLYLGDVVTGAVKGTPAVLGPATVVSSDPTVAGLTAHEFRVGLRYDFR